MDNALIVRITDHAYEQYCNRVAQIDRAELRLQIGDIVSTGHYRRKGEYAHINGVWWVCEIVGNVMLLITCYGRSDFDLPRALQWARRNKDRIRFSGGGESCEAEREAKKVR